MASARRVPRGAPAEILHAAILLGMAGWSCGFDLRVSKGMYTRGYNSVRLSVIGNGPAKVSAPVDWAWEAPFAHRWSSKSLHTKVLGVPEQGRTLHLHGAPVHLRLPREGSGVTGLLVSDPCFTGEGGEACPNGRRFKVLERLTRIVNTLVASDEFDFWGILGDNFYDKLGEVTSEFFDRLSTAAKSKLFVTVPGNHDFWIGGSPALEKTRDELGYGFMQFFGQDTVAGLGTAPYNFSRGTTDPDPENVRLAQAANFIFGTQIGDLALFGYSGAHDWEATRPHAVDFCRFVGRTASVETVVLLGHWNKENLGCKPGMDVPSVYEKLKGMEGCSSKRLLYFTGHEHCNKVVDYGPRPDQQGPLDAVGFMIGGTGMFGEGCSQFGFTVIQSDLYAARGPDVRVEHFQVAEDKSFGGDSSGVVDRFDELFACLNRSGYAGCRKRFGLSYRATSSDSVVFPMAAPPADESGPASPKAPVSASDGDAAGVVGVPDVGTGQDGHAADTVGIPDLSTSRAGGGVAGARDAGSKEAPTSDKLAGPLCLVAAVSIGALAGVCFAWRSLCPSAFERSSDRTLVPMSPSASPRRRLIPL